MSAVRITLQGGERTKGTHVIGGVAFTDGTAEATLTDSQRRFFDAIGAKTSPVKPAEKPKPVTPAEKKD